MSDGALTQDEIDALLSSMDERHEKERRARKSSLKRNALTVWGLLRAIRDNWMGEYRVNFTLTDEEAEELIVRYAKKYHKR
jgi:hypothetical protein